MKRPHGGGMGTTSEAANLRNRLTWKQSRRERRRRSRNRCVLTISGGWGKQQRAPVMRGSAAEARRPGFSVLAAGHSAGGNSGWQPDSPPRPEPLHPLQPLQPLRPPPSVPHLHAVREEGHPHDVGVVAEGSRSEARAAGQDSLGGGGGWGGVGAEGRGRRGAAGSGEGLKARDEKRQGGGKEGLLRPGGSARGDAVRTNRSADAVRGL